MFWSRRFGPRKPSPPPETISRPVDGWVSVWTADYTDELDLDGYFRDK